MSEPAIPSVSYAVFAHLNVDKTPLYRAILNFFVAERTRFVISLRPSEIHAALTAGVESGISNLTFEIDAEGVSSALQQLRTWGNLDAGGLQIARRVIGEHGARPWRMSAADYLAAPKGKPIAADAQLASPWDSALAEALAHERRAVHEEAVADILLQDLARP
jgi:hypothetical protein